MRSKKKLPVFNLKSRQTMAKTNEQFDQIFREKLDGHQEKPSTLAWERLESQLPKSHKAGWGVWLAVAASVSALLMVAYLNWPSLNGNSENKLITQSAKQSDEMEAISEPFLAEMNSQNDISQSDKEHTQTEPNLIPQSTISKPETSTNTKFQPEQTTSVHLIAEANTSSRNNFTEPVEIPEIKATEPNLTLPELKAPDLTKTVALSQDLKEDEPLYRVNIYSNGIKKGDPVEKNLITELGKTFGQVEGLLGKVDEGFAEIQDKKDNLFASLTSRKDRGEK
jgi:cytoskeletal protein RodZ